MNNKMQELAKPFAASEIEWRVGSTNKDKTKGMALPYVSNRAIMNRLDEVFGIDGWCNEFRDWKGSSQLCGISAYFEGHGWVTKWDGADNTDFEATKGGLSDSMKRAAVQWGIGRYLYSVPVKWVAIKAVGKSYALEESPTLPAWALPEGEKGKVPTKPAKEKEYKPSTKVKKLLDIAASKNFTIEQVKIATVRDYKQADLEKLTEEQIQEVINKISKV